MGIRFWVVLAALANLLFGLWAYTQSGGEGEDPVREVASDKLSVTSANLVEPGVPPSVPLDSPRRTLQKADKSDNDIGKSTLGAPSSTATPKAAGDAGAAANNRRPIPPPAVSSSPSATPSPSATRRTASAAADAGGSCFVVGSFTPAQQSTWQKKYTQLKGDAKKNTLWELRSAAVSSRQRAQAEAKRLKAEKNLRMANVSSRAPWAVIVGRFSQERYAQAAQGRLAGRGVKTEVVEVPGNKNVLEFSGLSSADEKLLRDWAKANRKSVTTCNEE